MGTINENKDKLKNILTEMFQFDQSDLDFGIYRIMNQKRDKIKAFMDNDLFSEIDNIKSELKKQDKNNEIDIEKLEADIYSYLTEFFRRYYDEGDFISQRRYKDGVYAIPYEGEEVKLHWANHDQYYVKSSEYFKDYVFSYKGKKVHFKLLEANIDKDNNKGGKKTFQCIVNLEQYNENLEENKKIKSNPEINENEIIVYFVYQEDDNNAKNIQDDRNKEAFEYMEKYKQKNNALDLELLLRKDNKKDSKSEFERQLNRYTARNTYDYFIHKDLKGFLNRELDFYIKNEILHIEDISLENMEKMRPYIAKAKAVEMIAKTIIEFLSQIEEFQKALWLKKKFIIDTNYCITLDNIDKKFYKEISENDKQIQEWIKLFAINEIEGFEKVDEKFLEENPYLVLDTKFFTNEFKDQLISNIDDLDDKTNGLLINSDNFHALNLLQEKYKEKIDCVYIDPPYNTEGDRINRKFLYKDGFSHSSWITMIYDRLIELNYIMSDKARIFISIDDNEQANLKLLCNIIFSNDNFVAEIPTIMNLKGNQDQFGFAGCHEYTMVYVKNKNIAKFNQLKLDSNKISKEWFIDEKGYYKKGATLKRTGNDAPREKRPYCFFPILEKENRIYSILENEYFNIYDKKCNAFNDEYILMLKDKYENDGYNFIIPKSKNKYTSWRWSYNTVKENYDEIIIVNGKDDEISLYKKQRPENEVPTKKPKTVFYKKEYSSGNGTTELENLLGKKTFDNPKPITLIEDFIKIGSSEKDIIVDYFSGSGTTGHAVIDLNREDGGNRKYILVEMGEYFDTVTKPRIQKVIYSKDWKDGKPISRQGTSHIFKYFNLESYEDSLNNIVFAQDDRHILLGDNSLLEKEYLLTYMLQDESKDSMCFLNIDKLKDPFGYKMEIVENYEKNIKNIDVVETFNYLIGIKILRNYAVESYDAEIDIDEYSKEKARLIEGDRYKFKMIEGILPDEKRALIVWRNITEDTKSSNLALNAFLQKKSIKSTDFEYDIIYVNGDNFIKNIELGEVLKVNLIDDEMKKRMF